MDQPAPARTQALAYDGRVGELYGVFLMNLLWTVLTLGIFRFWAITRTRRYVWAHMRFGGERLEYTGTGGELFVGYLLAVLTLIGAYVVAGILGMICYAIWPPLVVLPVLLFFLGLVVLAAGAVFSAQRYRLSRTLWAGIRGGMDGSMVAYGLRAVGYTVLVVLTLFQLAPWRAVRLAERRINASFLGTLRFRFQGRAGPLYLVFLLSLLGCMALAAVVGAAVYAVAGPVVALLAHLPATGGDATMTPAEQRLLVRAIAAVYGGLILFGLGASLISLWYAAAFERHVAGHTTLGPLRFSSTVTGAGLLGLILGNLLILVFTLGLGFPVATQRTLRFLSRNLWVEGGLDLASLEQGFGQQPRMAEGMFQVLDGGGTF